SALTITAFPQVVLGGKTVTSNNLSFEWKRNDTPITQSSGKGRNQITFSGNQLFPGENVSVDVVANGVTVARGAMTVPKANPQVLLYERDPLRGILSDTAFSNSVSLVATELTVQAVPYYFANSSVKNGSVPFVWKLNNEDAVGPQTALGILTLRQSGSGAGRASLEVSMQNSEANKYVQSAVSKLQILFGGASNSTFNSFFGI
ncbi:MAG: hypothetical protein V4436_03900, partial [Patescibacteria group bacterium]